MRVTFRSDNARGAWLGLQALAAANTSASALVGDGLAAGGEDIAILDVSDGNVAKAHALAARLRSRSPGPILVLAAGAFAAPPMSGFRQSHAAIDAWMPLDASPIALGRQIERAKRLAAARHELAARRVTAERLRIATPAAGPLRGLKLVYIGAPQPFYLSLERWVRSLDGTLTAAFTSFAGFDHLHDEAYDAAVLNAQDDPQTALAICGAMRRNAGLHHLPTLLIVEPGKEALATSAFERGASLVCTGEDPAVLGWLFEAIRVERSRACVERGLFAVRDHMGEPRTGLFRSSAFLSHIDTLCGAHADGGRALSLAALQVVPWAANALTDTADWRRGVAEAASLVGRLIRASDCATLIDDTIVLALTSTDHAGACKAVDRVIAVTECTSLGGADAAAGSFVMAGGVVQQDPGEGGGALMMRLLSPLIERSKTA